MTEISDSTQRAKRQRTSDTNSNAASDKNTPSLTDNQSVPVQATQIKLLNL